MENQTDFQEQVYGEKGMKGTSKFPKIYRVDAPEVTGIFDGPVEITEKIDGSQFGFGLINDELVCRSKGALLHQGSTCAGLFAGAVVHVRSIKDSLTPGWFYYGEAVQNKRHNKLTYDRVPKGHIVLFGIKKVTEQGAVFIDDWNVLNEEAQRLGIDVAPLIYAGVMDSVNDLEELLNKPSVFGAQFMEGVVVKRYGICGRDCSSLMVAKLVNDEFREVQKSKKARKTDKGAAEQLAEIIECYHTTARFDKAIQHLRDAGQLTGTNADIKYLVQEVQRDLLEEEAENIKNDLWAVFSKTIVKGCVKDLANYYMAMPPDHPLKACLQ